MTQEEKAKRYEEALERANKIYTDKYKPEIAAFCKQSLENIFPELKESEDERIRKAIIESLPKHGYLPQTNINVKDAVSWLEKQSKKPQGKSALEAINEEKVDNQNCVKPTDKVEPIFKVGEWLTENHPNNYARFVQILEIVNVQGKKRYRISRDLHNDEDIVECRFVEDNWHHFNMQDAKDGDVLVCENGWTCIFKTLVNDKTFSSYCFMDSMKWFCETGSECHTLEDEFVKAYNGKIYPATKEQRDTLMKAITDAGYEWNADKKELKKVEQNPTNKFDITTLKPFDKVLVRDNNKQKWTVDLFSFYDKDLVYIYACVGHYANQCIPYEDNEHLLGTTDDCDEYYKTWE